MDISLEELKKMFSDSGERIQWSERTLEEHFDKCLEKLRKKGCQFETLESLSLQKKHVVEKASEATFAFGEIPFLPVLPRRQLGLREQMKTLLNAQGKKRDVFFLDVKRIKDDAEVLKLPYFIFGILIDYSALSEERPMDKPKILTSIGRHGLSCTEAIVLRLFKENSGLGPLEAIGSKYNGEDFLVLYTTDNGMAQLGWVGKFDARKEALTPSCRERMTFLDKLLSLRKQQ